MSCNQIGSKALVVLGLLVVGSATNTGMKRAGQASRPATIEGQSGSADGVFGGYSVLKTFRDEVVNVGGRHNCFPRFVFEDNAGRFWIAHAGPDSGVQVYDERLDSWALYRGSGSGAADGATRETPLLPARIESICQSKDGIMWFSDRSASDEPGGGIALSSFDGSRWRSFPVGRSDFIGLIQGLDGRVWLWARDELRYWDNGRWSEVTRLSEQFAAPPDPPTASARGPNRPDLERRDRERYYIIGGMQDREGYVWLSTSSTVLTLNPQTGEIRRYPQIKDTRTDSIYEDHQGRVWFNLAYSVVMYDRSKEAVTYFKPLNHFPPEYGADHLEMIGGIYQDARGRMVFATSGGLLFLEEAGMKWGFADVKGLGMDKDGVTNDLANISEDSHGRIWLVSIFGIAVLGQ
jgi:hypothetical protein